MVAAVLVMQSSESVKNVELKSRAMGIVVIVRVGNLQKHIAMKMEKE